MEGESEHAEHYSLKREIQKLENEQVAFKAEGVEEKKVKATSRALADLREKAKEIESKWRSEKDVIDTIKNIKKDLEDARFQVEREQTSGNSQKAAEIKYATLPDFMKKLSGEEKKPARFQKTNPLLKEEVTDEDVAHVVARWTGIPVTRLMAEEAKKLEKMENELKRRIDGQEQAVAAIYNAMRRMRAGVSEENTPLGFL